LGDAVGVKTVTQDNRVPSCSKPQRRRVACLAVIVLIAMGVRVFLALQAEMISRDGAKFIWYAQGLGCDPLAEMRTQDQHPLYPTLILASHKVLEGMRFVCGAVPDHPIRSWALAGVIVSLAGSAVLIIAVYLLAQTLFDTRVGIIAAMLAATAAEFCQLSADVLSDMPHLAVYLLAMTAGIRGLRDQKRVWLFAAGALSGMAFLIRPEGAEVAMVLAVGVVFLTRGWPMRNRAIGVIVVCLGAAIVASPYMAMTGKLVPKKSIKQMLWGDEAEQASSDTGVLNVPEGRHENSPAIYRWECRYITERKVPSGTTELYGNHRSVVPTGLSSGWSISKPSDESLGYCRTVPTGQEKRLMLASVADRVPLLLKSNDHLHCSRAAAQASAHRSCPYIQALKTPTWLFAFGRVAAYWVRSLRVTFLLPIVVWLIRRRRPAVEKIGAQLVMAALSLHVMIAIALIVRFDYWTWFSLRHVMILAGLTLPFSAAGIAAILEMVPCRRHRIIAIVLVMALVGPTVPWMLETRHNDQLHIRKAGQWICEHGERAGQLAIMTNRHRAAFYANGTWIGCPSEDEVDQILTEARYRRPQWLVFDEKRCIKAVPDFFERLERSTITGETLQRVNIVSASDDLDNDRAIIYRYEAPGLPTTNANGKD